METFLGIDYPTWWFIVVGGLFSGYAVLDGFDFGAGAWHLFFKKEHSRRIALNAVGPVWDGNEVWLVIGTGALFAGFPTVYATIFSTLYIPVMLFLFMIILRAVSIEFRSKEKMKWWRKTWDACYSFSSIALALLLGLILGNVLQGLPFGEHQVIDTSQLQILTPFTILLSLTTLLLFMMHGGMYLLMKTEGKLFTKVNRLTRWGLAGFFVLIILLSIFTLKNVPHLSDRFFSTPVLFIIPVLALLSLLNIPRLLSKEKYFQAFIFSSASICFFLMIVAIELYPYILLSSLGNEFDVTVQAAAASEKTLGIMLLFVVIGAPLVISYTVFVYRTFKGKVLLDETSY